MATENNPGTANAPAAMPPVEWHKLHALGWPEGSVRAFLALLIFATVWALLLLRPSMDVPGYLRDLLFIILGHYFASRRRGAPEPGEVSGPSPLYLPRGTIRLVLVAGSVAVAVVLHRRGQLVDPAANPGVVTLLLVAGFLLGVALRTISAWWAARGHRPHRALEDLRALVGMLAAAALAALVLNRLSPVFPPDAIDATFRRYVGLFRVAPEQILAAVVGFYFGSRS